MNEHIVPMDASPSAFPSRTMGLADHGQEILREARALTSAAGAAAEEANGLLRQRLAERPYTTLAIAAGFGYVIGGGAATRLTRVLLNMGSRFAMAVITRELSVMLLESKTSTEETRS